MLPLFSILTPLPGICGSLAVLAGPEACLCGSFSGQPKPGSQSLTHKSLTPDGLAPSKADGPDGARLTSAQ